MTNTKVIGVVTIEEGALNTFEPLKESCGSLGTTELERITRVEVLEGALEWVGTTTTISSMSTISGSVSLGELGHKLCKDSININVVIGLVSTAGRHSTDLHNTRKDIHEVSTCYDDDDREIGKEVMWLREDPCVLVKYARAFGPAPWLSAQASGDRKSLVRVAEKHPTHIYLDEEVPKPISKLDEEQKKAYDREKKALGSITMSLTRELFHSFRGYDTSKDLWKALQKRFEGNSDIKKSKRDLLRKQYECFNFMENESLDDLISRFYHLQTELKAFELKYPDEEMVEKFLDALPPKFEMRAREDLRYRTLPCMMGRLPLQNLRALELPSLLDTPMKKTTQMGVVVMLVMHPDLGWELIINTPQEILQQRLQLTILQ
ncbi:hypothetical protein L1987_20345 [Smallanthus sonchifolius]|uniref:Uncharacterized protein n=1 Tax=Smallanthus sonchifolius TaxID=185202 RepID=A0ACB9IT90_9ASTR|nr:hypothetical protein L1987_20345 [Smallanthus sonchifolius]